MTPDEYKVFWIWMVTAFVCVQVVIGTLFLAVGAVVVKGLADYAIRQIAILLGRG